MVNGDRVKEYTFQQLTVNGSDFSQFSNHSINGEILRVLVQNPQIGSPGVGSIFLSESGTNLEFFRKNGIVSGTGYPTFEAYPQTYIVNTNNVTGSPSTTNKVSNSEIHLNIQGLTSGTSKVFGPVTLYYR